MTAIAEHGPFGRPPHTESSLSEETLPATRVAALEETLPPEQTEGYDHNGKLAPDGALFASTGELVPEDDPVMVFESGLNIEELEKMPELPPAEVRIAGIDSSHGDWLDTVADKHHEWPRGIIKVPEAPDPQAVNEAIDELHANTPPAETGAEKKNKIHRIAATVGGVCLAGLERVLHSYPAAGTPHTRL